MADGRFSILIDDLAPKETFGFELLAINRPLPEIVNVRSETALAVKKTLELQPVAPRWLFMSVLASSLIGLMMFIYWLTLLIQLIASPAP